MGRETKILLGLLAALAVCFVAALGSRLLVSRPPTGAGVDVHPEIGTVEEHEVVEPPGFGRPAVSAFAAAERQMPPDEQAPVDAIVSPADEPLLAPTSPPAAAGFRSPVVQAQSPVVQASYDEPVVDRPRPTVAALPQTVPRIAVGTTHAVAEGDSWWGIAEAAYGDGECYRALYAWNRVLDPRVSLTPGTRVAIPTRDQLSAAHGSLLPSSAGRIDF